VVLYKSQRFRLHHHLYHPSTGKLYKFLKSATPDLVTGETKKLLDEIAKSCHTFQIYSNLLFTSG
jgi:hypothetical protein